MEAVHMVRSGAQRSLSLLWMMVLASSALLVISCGGDGASGATSADNLLAGKLPTDARGVAYPARLTDGFAAPNADHWESQITTRIKGGNGHAIYDLGEETPIASIWLQGDHNDNYLVEGSLEGSVFQQIWVAGPVSGSGVQERSVKGLKAKARYLRISANAGDQQYSLSEVQVFSSDPTPFPPRVARKSGFRSDIVLRTQVIMFGLALALFGVLAYRGARWWWIALLAAPTLYTGYVAISEVINALPTAQRTVSLVRGMIGVVAALMIAREAFAPKRFLAHRGVVLSVLSTCGVIGLLSFYNLGYPQFWDHETAKPTFVHHLDLRQYYATAKYFPELSYVEMYAADVAAYLDDNPQLTLDQISNQNMRDLVTHRVSTVGAQRERILKVKQRFSPERWEDYKVDQRYFRKAMGVPSYLEMMNDLGGNATPVWISIGYLMFNELPASNANFVLTGLFDPLLLIAALIAIGFIFGPRTACLCMVLFGANDLIMYGSNWGGATLRHDWMAYLAFGACALRKQKWALGGVFLSMATLIRAFPALSLIALGLPLFWQVVESLWVQRKLPTLGALIEEQRWMLRVAIAALITVVVAVLISSAILGADAWPAWWSKVSQLTADPHANHISLKSLIAGSEFDQRSVLRTRIPVFVVACLAYVAMIAVGARNKRPEQIAMLGMIMLPIFFYPANYYIHFMWLIPMIVIEQGRDPQRAVRDHDAWVWVCLMLLCGAQYWTTLITDRPLHFYLGSVCLFGAISALLTVYARAEYPALVAMLERRYVPQLSPALAVDAALPQSTPTETPSVAAPLAEVTEPDDAGTPDRQAADATPAS